MLAGLNNAEPIRLKSLLQKLNVITLFSPLGEGFSGMAIKTSNKHSIERFMLVNSSQSLGKQHFTISHELYHLYFQENFTSQVCNTGRFDKKADKNEYYADIFASFLLLPTEGLLACIPNAQLRQKTVSLATILYIENFFSCSRRALLYRMKKMGFIDSNGYDEFAKHVKRGALENGYGTSLYENGNHNQVIGDYGSIARSLFDQDKISESHYYSLLKDLGVDITKLSDAANGDN
jgi:Zn-dependent peptidase ImmA (M78 family)